jgi:hypothetical protein
LARARIRPDGYISAPIIVRHGTEQNQTEWLPLIIKVQIIRTVGHFKPEAETETVRFRYAKLGPDYANQLRRRRPGLGDKWYWLRSALDYLSTTIRAGVGFAVSPSATLPQGAPLPLRCIGVAGEVIESL